MSSPVKRVPRNKDIEVSRVDGFVRSIANKTGGWMVIVRAATRQDDGLALADEVAARAATTVALIELRRRMCTDRQTGVRRHPAGDKP
jgi:hypothetical protein